jgi:hypothetical protein
MKSSLFQPRARATIEGRVKSLLNERSDFLSEETADSPRAAGDAIEGIIKDGFAAILGEYCVEYSDSFARRAMADLAFKDSDGNYYVVDVKTHREGTVFNMPNLTSVDRLARFYEDDSNYFVVLLVKYAVCGTSVAVSQVLFHPIEHLSWECLTLGALGKGQIQIANAKHIEIDDNKSRKRWMLEFCDNLFEFYPREIRKIDLRIQQFKKVKAFWQDKRED